jgi:catechol 2,3-dioxygenase-like lactoylglutathione lyase family enzyme
LGPSARCFSISTISDIALAVGDVDRAEAFYRDVLGLRRLYRFGDLTFFDCAGVRLMLEKSHSPENIPKSSVIYFRCGVTFSSKPHLIARMDDHDLWMAFFTDADGHTLALMQEAPKGYTPTAV